MRSAPGTEQMLSVMEVILSLKATPLFRDVPGEGLKRLSDFIHEKTVAADEIIFAEQDLGDEMYLVRKGSVSILQTIDGELSLLETVAPGGYFGEMAIIDDQPRAATAKATEPTSLLVLHGNDFRAAVQDYPDIAFEVFREFTRRIRAADERYRKLAEEARRLGLETH
jgi:CRP-like cAMP-binding protein